MSAAVPHSVAVLALDGVAPFDLGIPCEVFGQVLSAGGAPACRVHVGSGRRKVRAAAFDIHIPHGLDQLVGADTVIVPGVSDLGRRASCNPCPRRSLQGRRPDGRGGEFHWNGASIVAAGRRP